jgi:O-antigen ligase
MPRAVGRLALAFFPLWCTAGVLVLWTPWRQKLIVGSVAALTLVSPAYGLLALAVLTPLGTMIESATGLPYRLSESFVMAFLGAWLLRATTDRRGPAVPRVMAAAGWLLGLAAFASVAVVTWLNRGYPREISELRTWLLQAYYVVVDRVGFVDAARIVEGLALVVATLYVFRRKPALAVSLPAALCVSGAVSALLAILIWQGIGPSALVDKYTRLGFRSAHVLDVNAAGSYFAMLVCLSLGMMLRADGKSRALWAALAAANAIGLWFSESRSAMAAAAIVIAMSAGWMLTVGWTTRARLAVVAAVLAVTLVGTAVRERGAPRDPRSQSGLFREQFNATSLRMIAARPLAGVGVGQYYRTSALFLTPQMAWTYGHENAHNYFLQTAAELGLPGLALFLIWIGAALISIARALARWVEPRLLGAAAGVSALLATCATGHPLLVNEAAFPFWILFALAFGLAQSSLMNAGVVADRSHRWPTPVSLATAAAAAAIVLAAFTSAARGLVQPLESRGVTGLFEWETGEDGRRTRWTEEYASVFVPGDVTRVSISARMPATSRAISPMGVTVGADGVPQYRTLVGPEWVNLDVAVPFIDLPTRFKRIDLKVDRTWQPAVFIAGSGDMRHVGVQIAKCELIR